MASERIGFIGLGVMGKPMARNLVAAGHELVVWSRTRADVDELAGDGATAASSAREVAEQAGVTILMLPDSPQVREVLDGEDGLLAGAARGGRAVARHLVHARARARPDDELVPGLHQVAGHGLAHDAEADEADAVLRHHALLSGIQPRLSSVVAVVGLYSRPIHPS